ncbi:MAG: hypothetical protein QMC94_08630 [Anaerosomatales bacterium]|nr:hypothetical protein [Anaerosomatales bacterium]
MDVVLPPAPSSALLTAGLIVAAALMFFAARLAVRVGVSTGLVVAIAAIAGGVIARVLVDQLLDVAGFMLAATLFRLADAVAGVLAARGTEAGLLLGAGVAAGIAGGRSPRWAWLLVAAVAAGASGLLGLPGSGAAAYAAGPAQLPDWLAVADTLGRHAAWTACLLAALVGGAVSGRGGARHER